jgi:DNA-binding GntR family transcriptional regulator
MNIVVRTLSDQTYEIVRRRILVGAMQPGTAVRQDVIAAELGVSKIPLREALGRLEQDGLLSSYPNRGYVVRDLSTDEASEVFALRLKLEPGAHDEGPATAAVDLATLIARNLIPYTVLCSGSTGVDHDARMEDRAGSLAGGVLGAGCA